MFRNGVLTAAKLARNKSIWKPNELENESEGQFSRLIVYKDRMRETASSVDSQEPNAVRRKYPSPCGPKPDPGVPTT